MAPSKKEDDLTLKIRSVREGIREKVREDLLRQCKEFQNQGKYPWEGMWLIPQEIVKLQKKLKRRDRVVFVEVIILFFIFGFFTFVVYGFMVVLLLP